MTDSKTRLLIVDHNAQTAQRLGAFLKRHDFEVVTCSAAPEARQWLERWLPGLVLLDADMPNSAALELSFLARSVASRPHIVLMVSPGMGRKTMGLLEHDDELKKPFTGRAVREMALRWSKGSTDAAQETPALVSPRLVAQEAPSTPRIESSPQVEPSPRMESARIEVSPRVESSPRVEASRPAEPDDERARGGQGEGGRGEAPGAGIMPSIPGLAQRPRPARMPALGSSSSGLAISGVRLPGGSPSLPSVSPSTSDSRASSGNIRIDAALKAPPGRGRPASGVVTLMYNAGQLDKTPFPALLYKLFANRDTGILTIHRSGSERAIFFDKGEPIYASSNAANDALGSILVNFNYLTLEQLNLALEQRAEGRGLGEQLLEMDLIDHAQLLEALERQTYERILGCFAFQSGSYIFGAGDDWMDEVRPFRQNPIQLISDGVQRYVDPNMLATALQSALGRYVVRTEKFEPFLEHFPVDAWRSEVLARIDGSSTLQALTMEYGQKIMPLLRLIWSLKQADMIDFLDTPRTEAVRSPDKPVLPSRAPTMMSIDSGMMARALEQARASQVQPARPRAVSVAQVPASPLARSEAAPSASARSEPEAAPSAPVVSSAGSSGNIRPLGGARRAPSSPRVAARSGQDKGSAQSEALTRVVVDYTMRLGSQNHWELLEISPEASSAELRNAFHAALTRLPLEQCEQLPPNVRKQALEVRMALKRAFQTLNEPGLLLQYRERIEKRRQSGPQSLNAARPRHETPERPDTDEIMRTWSSTDSRAPGNRTSHSGNAGLHEDPELEASQSRAAIKLRHARRLIAEERWKEAYQFVRAVTMADGQNGEANVLLVWIIYNLPHEDPGRQARVCRNRLEFELQLDGCNPETYYFIGRIAEVQGELEEAHKHYRAAVTLLPEYEEATRARDRLARRLKNQPRDDSEDQGGVFGKLRDLFKRDG